MMERIFQNLFTSDNSDIPQVIEKKFKSLFRQAESVEWMPAGNDFEALFYEQRQEKIVRFDTGGNLLDIRINHSPQDFEGFSSDEFHSEGSIMNYIEIRRGNAVFHELIIKNSDLSRYLVLLNEKYEIVKQEQL